MEFHTHIDIAKPKHQITHCDRIVMLGSCFADNISALLKNDAFQVLANPFGTLYNPASIALHLWRCLSEKDSSEIIYSSQENLWHSWLHHSSFSDSNKDKLIEKINAARMTTAEQIRNARWLIVTFGSSYIYRLKDNGILVANCHKQPDNLFLRSRLSAYDIVDQWTPLLQMLRAVNPDLHVIFTISPIRHKRDGLHQNQLSKAELLLAVDKLVGDHLADYFPAYEIMMDELRDYRFYADDMIHPSQLAIDYIYERFETAYINENDKELSRRCRKVRAVLNHHPFNPDSLAYKQLVEKTQIEINKIKSICPNIVFN